MQKCKVQNFAFLNMPPASKSAKILKRYINSCDSFPRSLGLQVQKFKVQNFAHMPMQKNFKVQKLSHLNMYIWRDISVCTSVHPWALAIGKKYKVDNLAYLNMQHISKSAKCLHLNTSY